MKKRRLEFDFGGGDWEALTQWSTSGLQSVRCALRAKMVLMAAVGFVDSVIAADLGLSQARVRRWVTRYAKLGLKGIEKDAPRGGRPRKVSASEVVRLTTQTQRTAATHWSTRTMAAQVGASAATVSRIWRAHGLKPPI